MKPQLIVSVLILGVTTVLNANVKTIPGGVNPESVVKAWNGVYYVTVINDGAKDGDGTVCRIVDDKLEVFATGLDNPKGIAYSGDFLIVADQKKVWKIDAKGQVSVLAAEKDFPHPVLFLNDVATALEGDGEGVYITDMGAKDKMFGKDGLLAIDCAEAKELPALGRVYRIGLDGKISVAIESCPEMPCPNGVTMPSKGTLLVGEFFTGTLMEFQNGVLTPLASGMRGADGIERDSEGNVYVSSWTQGKVWKVAPNGKPVVLIEGLKSAADFYLDEAAGHLVLPDMLGGTISFVPIR